MRTLLMLIAIGFAIAPLPGGALAQDSAPAANRTSEAVPTPAQSHRDDEQQEVTQPIERPRLTWEAGLVLGIVIIFIAGLAYNVAPPDLLAMACLVGLIAAGELTGSKQLPSPLEGFQGFATPGLLTVGALFIVVAGLVQTGAMTWLTQPLLGHPKSTVAAQVRVMLPVATVSGFLNNTPVVAMFMPVVNDLCKKTGISPSKLFMPMCFGATLGGMCTLIGTSTNLVVAGAMERANLEPVGMFDITWVGLPACAVGLTYMIVAGRWLLPNRKPAIDMRDDPRQYSVEMIVPTGSPLVGQTIEQAGLRHLPGLFLAEIERDGDILPAVGPETRLKAEDRLVFVGVVESVVDLQKIRGLRPATNQVFKLNAPVTQRSLIEAVVSDRCPVVGKTIREGKFRTNYNAAVIAVGRSGRRITGKIGDIELQAGDTLLLEAHRGFAQQMRNSPDFYLVSSIENSAPPRHDRTWIAIGILLAMILVAAFEWLEMATAAFLAGGTMIVSRCCSGGEARRSVDWSVLVVIGASLGIGKALETTGLAEFLASPLVSMGTTNPWLTLAAFYVVTVVLTELISNNAAAALMFPVALGTAHSLGVDFMPFAITLMIAASAGFATPIGYQTNLMVYGPGGYRFSDYVKVGVPLDILIGLVTVPLVPMVYPFHP